MHPATKAGFISELAKIAARRKADEGRPARLANNLFGLPYEADHKQLRRGVRKYEESDPEGLLALQGDASLGGPSQANVPNSEAVRQSVGPGGV